ncbi:uncharacterized protein LOC126325918 [Schistocerca gregaria]|uniref:uncharacterized protein LOC126325918 n=1 Tax=Schistocerca gregaria TaxID=7010 RepID=UPI00211EE8FC|nr:uncharacterized protein LOC126325918 [Schistocerca gregaria]
MQCGSDRVNERIFEIVGSVKNYKWGKRGNNSLVRQLTVNSLFLDSTSDDHYAELWFGTHPSGPSQVIPFSKKEHPELNSLAAHLYKDADAAIGNTNHVKLANSIHLPFLFKVLSIRTALSIQTHPDAKLAKKLHQQYPEIYKDSKHKPELVIALTNTLVMCGFRPLNEIAEFLRQTPELTMVIDKNIVNEFLYVCDTSPASSHTKPLKRLFSALLCADKYTLSCAHRKLLERMPSFQPNDSALKKVLQALLEDFFEDAGLLCAFLFNVIELSPGEALFLKPNTIHAYISGDCIECMAASDNVIRAGLTQKYKDIDMVINTVNYKAERPKILRGENLQDSFLFSPFERIYAPPVSEFQVGLLRLDQESHIYVLPALPAISIVLVYRGSGILTRFPGHSPGYSYPLKTGRSYIIYKDTSVEIHVKEEIVLYRACPSMLSSLPA